LLVDNVVSTTDNSTASKQGATIRQKKNYL